MLEFEWPWLLLLLIAPLLIKPRIAATPSSSRALRIPFYNQLEAAGLTEKGTRSQKKSKLIQLLKVIAWVSLVVAASRPQYVGELIEVPISGRDLMVAVDISPSMKEEDMILNGYQVTRLDTVKSVVSDFVEQRKGDRVGLILFGSQPYIQAPLSFDTVTVNTLLQEAFLGMAGRATAIGDAITLAVKRLRERPQNSRVLILLTDGANTAGEIQPQKAAQLAAKENIKIYTIGIGAEQMVKHSILGSRTVNPSKDLDEKALQEIADTTGGQFFRARNTGELELIYEGINRLEPIEQEVRSYRPTRSYFHWPLALSLFALIAIMLTRVLTPKLSTLRRKAEA
ncbi:vWA domain-containing protein [Alkalimarinus sediminis]|uniref:VWA domain-containing protein n=1 Tax=Alkalimarinus sediminis TaxID=1632866 RepID=A0A9E8HMT7_9ALTE|nr:VWA domain-containing protein [Alkalimarinus sediminis]UZW75796.1 VWA domain-containing protein [Alkalimarinus sediminis]